MDRNAAHWDIFIIVLATLGLGNVQCGGCGDGIIKDQLVNIAHPIEQQGIRMGCLNFQVLRHHGRCWHRCSSCLG